jgi:hypothetical protein
MKTLIFAFVVVAFAIAGMVIVNSPSVRHEWKAINNPTYQRDLAAYEMLRGLSRELRAISAVSEARPAGEMFQITINLGANEVIRFSKPITPGIDDDGNVIEQKPLPMIEDDNDNAV